MPSSLEALDAREAEVRGQLAQLAEQVAGTQAELDWKAPGGGECSGPSPVDRRERGLKRSTATDGTGIPLGAAPGAEMEPPAVR